MRTLNSHPVITGYAFALPGARSTSALIDVLSNGKTTWSSIPPDRLPHELYLDPDAKVGSPKVSSALGGTLDPRDGERCQRVPPSPVVHRWLVEAVVQAMASAHLPLDAFRGLPVPIFVAHSRGGSHGVYDAALLGLADRFLPYLIRGAHPRDFTRSDLERIASQLRRDVASGLERHTSTHPGDNAVHRLAGVIAEALGTTEKALVVDGNCTGGLVALELACREVERGAPWAVAAATSYVDTANQVLYSNARLLSSTGCQPFAGEGDGTIISDGVVVLLVTSIERAQSVDAPVRAVIRGVAGANDGDRQRFMLSPDARGHEIAIRRALERANITSADVGIFLAHGSGTRVGDAVEAEVFRRVLERDGASGVPLLSIKGSVGHAKEASGLANLVALLSIFEAEQIPQARHATAVRDGLERDGIVALKETARPWPRGHRPRIGGVSAIASGGANYHALVEEGPASACPKRPASPNTGVWWRDDSVAIVGLASAFGDAYGLPAFWQTITSGRHAFRPVSLHPGEHSADCGTIELGAALEIDAMRFADSAERYGERPADILRFDPMHFLLVDLARAAANGLDIGAGENVTVVVSADHCSDYAMRQVAAARLPELEVHVKAALRATRRDPKEIARTVRAIMRHAASDLPELWSGSLFNVSPSFLAARIARAFDLTGPTCAIEAGGAASSFGGLDVACGRLLAHEVDAAFWATADARLGPVRIAEERAGGYLSVRPTPTALDASSDGYLPGEGATVFVLRRLSDAVKRGERIYGIIRAIGSSFGRPPETALVTDHVLSLAIQRAYAQCLVSADDLAFVECFGTGHLPSDTAEIGALRRTLGAARVNPLLLGTVMPHFGHTGAASGAASLLKALGTLSTGLLPATLGLENPIAGLKDNLHVTSAPLSLNHARFAGVNGGGAGGTHYHVIVEAGPDRIEVDS